MEFQHVTDSELAQIRNIIGDNPHKALDILRDCAEVAGLSTKHEYSNVVGIPLRTVQSKCNSGKLYCLDIDGLKFPCINCTPQC